MFAARDLLILNSMDYRNGRILGTEAASIGGSSSCDSRSISTIGMTFEQLKKTWELKKKGKTEGRG